MKNILAYYDAKLITAVKSFEVPTVGQLLVEACFFLLFIAISWIVCH